MPKWTWSEWTCQEKTLLEENIILYRHRTFGYQKVADLMNASAARRSWQTRYFSGQSVRDFFLRVLHIQERERIAALGAEAQEREHLKLPEREHRIAKAAEKVRNIDLSWQELYQHPGYSSGRFNSKEEQLAALDESTSEEDRRVAEILLDFIWTPEAGG